MGSAGCRMERLYLYLLYYLDELVEVRIIEEKKGHALAELVNIIEPHPQRIIPRCMHFGLCGGCHYQHIPYSLQLHYKQAIFIEQLQRIAGIEAPVIKEIIPSIEEWGFRNHLQFNLSEGGKLCFSDFYRNEPFEIRECHLPMAEVSSFWPQIEFEPCANLRARGSTPEPGWRSDAGTARQ